MISSTCNLLFFFKYRFRFLKIAVAHFFDLYFLAYLDILHTAGTCRHAKFYLGLTVLKIVIICMKIKTY